MSKSYLDKQLPISGVFVKDPSNMGEFPLIQSKDIILSSIDGTQPDYRLDKIIQVTPETGAVKIATQLNPETGDVADGATPIEVPTKTSQLTNDSSFVSGPLKTINGQSILGEGNISVQGGSGTEYELPVATTEQLGGIKPDGTTIVVNQQGVATAVAPEVDAYTKEDADNKFATKEFVQEEIDSAIAGGEVDLSNYYNKSEADNKFADKETVEQHINEYEAQVNTNLASINALQSKHTTELNKLDERVDNLEDAVDNIETIVYTPKVSSAGILSWTNNGELVNPDPVDIRGPKGEDGINGQDGKDIDAITIQTKTIDDNGENHFGELMWTTNPASTPAVKYSNARVIIEPEFECTVEDSSNSQPTVEVDPTDVIETATLSNGSKIFKPQYTMLLKDIAPKMNIKNVGYEIGGPAEVSVTKQSSKNEYDIDMTIPVPEGVTGTAIRYDSTQVATTNVRVEPNAETGGSKIEVELVNPVIISGATATMEDMNDKTINVTVSQVGNKATFNFAFPNILDDGELA